MRSFQFLCRNSHVHQWGIDKECVLGGWGGAGGGGTGEQGTTVWIQPVSIQLQRNLIRWCEVCMAIPCLKSDYTGTHTHTHTYLLDTEEVFDESLHHLFVSHTNKQHTQNTRARVVPDLLITTDSLTLRGTDWKVLDTHYVTNNHSK